MDRSTMVTFAVHTVAMDQHWADVGDRAVIERLLDLQAGAAAPDCLPVFHENPDEDMSDFNILIEPQSDSEGEGNDFDELIPPLASASDADTGDDTKVSAPCVHCACACTTHA